MDELEQEIGCAAAGPSEGVEVNNCNPLEPPEIVDHGQDEISESEEESEDEDDYDETDKEDSSLKEITEGGKVLKVKYKNYQSTILKQGLKNLMNR